MLRLWARNTWMKFKVRLKKPLTWHIPFSTYYERSPERATQSCLLRVKLAEDFAERMCEPSIGYRWQRQLGCKVIIEYGRTIAETAHAILKERPNLLRPDLRFTLHNKLAPTLEYSRIS